MTTAYRFDQIKMADAGEGEMSNLHLDEVTGEKIRFVVNPSSYASTYTEVARQSSRRDKSSAC